MKLLLGIIIGVLFASGVFYYINKTNKEKEAAAFIASTGSAKVISMNMNEPKNEDLSAKISVKNPLVILIDANDSIYYYNGGDCSKLQKTSIEKLRQTLTDKKKNTNPVELMIIIKTATGSSFKTTIDLLDEITVAGIKAGHHVEVDISENEKYCVKNYKKN